MVLTNTMSGDCSNCDFYRQDRCLRVEKLFSTMTDPVCLQKVQCMLLRDLAMTMQDYVYGEDDEEI